jgi:ribosome-associated translation inhibitor RaiA
LAGYSGTPHAVKLGIKTGTLEAEARRIPRPRAAANRAITSLKRTLRKPRARRPQETASPRGTDQARG